MLAFVASGAAYARAVPPWEAPDEPWHLAYAEALAQGRQARPKDTYESHQPPLGYALTALALRGLALDKVPRAPDNPWFPYAQAALWHVPGDPAEAWLPLLRTFSGLPAALVVALAWATTRAAVPRRRSAASAAAVLSALWPQFLFIGHALNNDGWAALWSGVVAYAVVVWVTRQQSLLRAAGMFAVAGGLAPLVKLNTLPVLAAVPLLAVWRLVEARRTRQAGSSPTPGPRAQAMVPLLAAAVGLAVSWATFALLLRDTARQTAAQAAWRGLGLEPSALGTAVLAGRLQLLAESTWARFGWLNVPLPRGLMAASLLLLGLMAVAAALGWRRQAPATRHAMAALALLVTLAGVATVKNLMVDPQPQGRLLFPAFAALVVLLAVGAGATGPVRRARLLLLALGTGLVLVNTAVLVRVLPGAYRASRGPLPDVAVRIAPPNPTVVATLGVGTPAVRQAFRLPGTSAIQAEVAVARADPGVTLEVSLWSGRRLLGDNRQIVPPGGLRNAWVGVQAAAGTPAPAGQLWMEVRCEGTARQAAVQLWGSADDVYGDGALWAGQTLAAAGGQQPATNWLAVPGSDLTLLVLCR